MVFIPGQHESVDNQVLVGRLVEERRGHHQQGVEPGGRGQRGRESTECTSTWPGEYRPVLLSRLLAASARYLLLLMYSDSW